MKTFFKAALITLSLSFVASSPAFAQELKKLGSVNSQKIMSNYWKMKVVNKELSVEEEKIKEENDAKVAQITALNDEIVKLKEQLRDPNLVRTKLEELEGAYKLKFNKLNNADRQRQEYIQGKVKALNLYRQNKQNELVKIVREEVNKYAAEQGFDAVMDKNAFLYLKEGYDITDAIIDIINKDSELTEEAPAPAPAPAVEEKKVTE